MTYEQFTTTMQTLKHAKNHLRAQRGNGPLYEAIARNQAITLLYEAKFELIRESHH